MTTSIEQLKARVKTCEELLSQHEEWLLKMFRKLDMPEGRGRER